MKKIIAAMLVLVMGLMMGTTVLAESVDLNADYTATDEVKVTFSWPTLAAVTFTWDGENHVWLHKENGNDEQGTMDQTVTIGVTNHSWANKTVKLVANVDNGSNNKINSAVFNGESTSNETTLVLDGYIVSTPTLTKTTQLSITFTPPVAGTASTTTKVDAKVTIIASIE